MGSRLSQSKAANIILFALFFIVVVLFFFRGVILNEIVNTLTRLNLSYIIKLKLVNLVFMLAYMIFFGVLGYKTALKRRLNVKKWTFYCVVLGVWAYLYILFFDPKK